MLIIKAAALFPLLSNAKGLRGGTIRLCGPEVDFYALGIGVGLSGAVQSLWMVGGLSVSRGQSDPRGPPSAVTGSPWDI